ncbi:ComEC/Rec2 family competence protein [Fulvivirga ligni]|uniref:ComEC/Rec2 family competence protein n=1 Tax=Fulvivirga ligni TaxID=2904246 RepID=UPI001F3A0736|nr:ComEC/Rec2 family competence protein [Fulvivirga ligni]UII21012.1 ComEC family competence protein [Fulvivirga ligni]
MLQWIPYAFVRLTISFIIGILFGIYATDLDRELIFLFVLLSMGLYIILNVTIRKNFFYYHQWQALTGFSATFFLGWLTVVMYNESLNADHLLHNQNDISYYTVQINGPAEEKTNTFQYEAELLQYRTDHGWQAGEATILLYLRKDTLLHYGDRLLIKGRPHIVEGPKNPHAFNYKQFLAYQNIYHQSFVERGSYWLINQQVPNFFLKYSYDIRTWADEQLKLYVVGDRERAIVRALALGLKDDIDNEVKEAYAASGAMHVLAVSGLHVGIIYLILLTLLGKLQHYKAGKWILAVISLLVLWSYAMVTGFSASVLRTVTMFTFIILGNAMKRQTNIYNSLAASAFFLLLFNPFLLFTVGFQLSYLAVLGIVYLQPRLYNLYLPDSWLVDKIWGITAVSLAAQLATFPLGLYYFHQFPSYFFLSNLIVIPAAFLILSGTLLILAVSWWSAVAALVGQATYWLVFGLNAALLSMKKWPFSQIQNIQLSGVEVLLLIVIILSVLLFFHFKKLKYARFGLFMALAFGVVRIVLIHQAQQSKVFVYHIKEGTAIDFMQGNALCVYRDSLLNPSEVNFHTSGNQIFHHKLEPSRLESGYRKHANLEMISWDQHTFLILNKKLDGKTSTPKRLNVDYVVIGRDFNLGLQWLIDNFDYKQLVLDGSLSNRKHTEMIKDADELGLDYYSVKQNGALEIIL